MHDQNMPLAQLLQYLQSLADCSLSRWDLPAEAKTQLLNVSENTTYLVTGASGHKSVLRIHRQGYHSRRAIECELLWLDALRASGNVRTPTYRIGKDSSAIQEIEHPALAGTHFAVLFDFVDGHAPDETGDITGLYAHLGALAAHCHNHALSWDRPDNFERLTWDLDSVFGPTSTWGNWRDAPDVSGGVLETLENVEQHVCARLERYGKRHDRYNLIHADMRFANLLVHGDVTQLIDFDDCGMGWLMYDFAAAISFIEDDPRIPEFKAEWVRGYRGVRPLNPEDEVEIDTFVMLRRMALLAWIGSHIEAPEPQKLANGFAATTARLGQAWLDSQT